MFDMFDILIRLWNEVWYFPLMVTLIPVLCIFVIIDYIFRFISSFVNQKKKVSQSKENLEIAWNQKEKELKTGKEILFKAKRMDNGEWIQGYLVKYQPVTSKNEWKIGIVPVYANDNDLIMVKPETVCQYVGLQDKNMTKIFEGDICKYYNSEDEDGIAVIREDYAEWKGGAIQQKEIMTPLFYLKCSSEWEILGNIFDNPELLEKI